MGRIRVVRDGRWTEDIRRSEEVDGREMAGRGAGMEGRVEVRMEDGGRAADGKAERLEGERGGSRRRRLTLLTLLQTGTGK